MSIHTLRIQDFRNIETALLSPIPLGLNVITGQNGSGKTSILEAIHYLSLGKSFRSSLSSRLIRHKAEKFSLFSQLVKESQGVLPVGVERDLQGGVLLKVNERSDVSTLEMASHLPIRLIHSQSHHLFESGPLYRRKFLDWGLFYQNDLFLNVWKQYDRILRQRNSLLKQRKPKNEIDPWTHSLVEQGNMLDHMRRAYIDEWSPFVCTLIEELMGISTVSFEYISGWDSKLSFMESLSRDFVEEHRQGHTQHGPHRADMNIYVEGLLAKHILSRGQQKLLICAMITAQGLLLSERYHKRLVYLVDDLPAELDSTSRARLIGLLARQNAQVFITAIEKDAMNGAIEQVLTGVKVFHVEHGNVTEC